MRSVPQAIGEWRMVSSTALAASSGCSASSAHWSGWSTRTSIGCGELVAGGVGARQQQAGGEHAQFVGVEAIAFVLGADEVGQQIVGQRVSPACDHLVDVVVEFAPGAHDERFVEPSGLKVKAVKMSSAHSENCCQSSRGAPSSAQMIGTG